MKASLLLAFFAAVPLIACASRRPDDRPPPQAQAIPEDPDGQFLKQLLAAGSDLSKPHNVDFFLYFPGERVASRACSQLAAEGFVGKVDRAAKGPGWLCFVTKRLVPTHAAMVTIRRRMEGLAATGGGEYDGWGTPVSR